MSVRTTNFLLHYSHIYISKTRRFFSLFFIYSFQWFMKWNHSIKVQFTYSDRMISLHFALITCLMNQLITRKKTDFFCFTNVWNTEEMKMKYFCRRKTCIWFSLLDYHEWEVFNCIYSFNVFENWLNPVCRGIIIIQKPQIEVFPFSNRFFLLFILDFKCLAIR